MAKEQKTAGELAAMISDRLDPYLEEIGISPYEVTTTGPSPDPDHPSGWTADGNTRDGDVRVSMCIKKIVQELRGEYDLKEE